MPNTFTNANFGHPVSKDPVGVSKYFHPIAQSIGPGAWRFSVAVI